MWHDAVSCPLCPSQEAIVDLKFFNGYVVANVAQCTLCGHVWLWRPSTISHIKSPLDTIEDYERGLGRGG